MAPSSPEGDPPGAAAREANHQPSDFRLPPSRLYHDWKEAQSRAEDYLDALGWDPATRRALAHEAVERALYREDWREGTGAVAETLRALRQLVCEREPVETPAWARPLAPFLAWRLARFLRPGTGAGPDATGARQEFAGGFSSMPPIARTSMAPEPIERRFFHRLFRRLTGRLSAPRADEKHESLRAQRRRMPWVRSAHRRRLLMLVLVLIPSVIASGFMVNVLPQRGGDATEVGIVIFFGALFGWISIGFWTAMLGFFTLLGRGGKFAITAADGGDTGEFRPEGRTAIVMPICEEPVERVFAGLQAIHASLAGLGALEHFDFFVLSDSSNPDTFVKEEEAWADWCRSVNGFGRIFYRRRRVRLRRKSGNVADFCRRWGSRYRYMIMLDADSIMAGETLVRLVRMMEKRPDAGMIQTGPGAVNRRSLFARIQQFSARVYGPMFGAGLHFWQLGDGQYWGHNTIIRIAPFMKHCALPKLPGKPPLGGEILSHDFVEAALMGRAGWTLWLAFDLGGSYEEVPATLLEVMKRDRRWCQGNLQHIRLLFSEGLFGAHRALFINGILSYVSALLWFAFLTLSTAEAVQNKLMVPDYFPHGRSLFPEWPIWRPDWAMYLVAVTGMILFLPKILSVLLITFAHGAKSFGGAARLSLSVLVEILLSSLFAPISMVFHSRFVVQNLLGRTVSWKSQQREDAETGWLEAIRHHGLDTVFASAWGIGLYTLNPDYFWWVTPIIGALILSIPVSVLASRVRLGDLARRLGLFVIPEESEPPPVLRDLQERLAQAEERPARPDDGLVRVAVDPYANALHRALQRPGGRVGAPIAEERRKLLGRAIAQGPGALSAAERRIVLSDPGLCDQLHEQVWAIADPQQADAWLGARP